MEAFNKKKKIVQVNRVVVDENSCAAQNSVIQEEFNEENSCANENSVFEEDFNEEDEESFNDIIKNWAVKHNVSRQCFDDLLKILSNEKINVPLSSKTLIKSKACTLRTVSPGSYLHIGLKNQLLKVKSVIENCESICLDINVDGLPLYKSSSLALWPILAKIVDNPRVKVFPIGIYLGNKKPFSVNCYLHDFVKEFADLKQYGLQIGDKIIKINIRSFVCDTPARSFICQIVGHNALEGCCKCDQQGRRLNNRTVFSSSCGTLRTDNDFQERRHASFHRKTVDQKLELEDLGIGMITQFPLDPMHLVDLGVTKKILTLLLAGKTKTKINKIQKEAISSKLLSLSIFIPKEFCRKPRGIDEIKRWKATEFRQFILYTGIVILADIVDDDFYYHFCLLDCSYRLLVAEQNYSIHRESAAQMLQYFVEAFSLIFPEDSVSFNVHSLLHLPDCVASIGYLCSFSSYDFENYLQQLKKQVKKPTLILEQLNNKISFDKYIVNMEESAIKLNKKGEIVYINTPAFYLSLKGADRFCYLKSGFAVEIKEFSKVQNKMYITGNRILNCTNYYERPVQSLDIGIFLSDGCTCTNNEIFKCEDISYKLMQLPHNNKYVFLPILHSQN